MFTTAKENETRDIQCPFDQEPKSTFTILKTLPIGIRSRVKDGFVSYEYAQDENGVVVGKSVTLSSERNAEVVRHGLKGFKNVSDGEKEINCHIEQNKLSEKTLQSLSSIVFGKDGYDTLVDWLAFEILYGSRLKDEDKKK